MQVTADRHLGDAQLAGQVGDGEHADLVQPGEDPGSAVLA
jgi:hypothetical protein